MSFKEALAILPKDTRISLDTTGSLTINGHTRDEFVAHGCPYKPIDDNGNMWVIYGIVSADEPDREALPDYHSLTFEGTAKFEKQNTYWYNFIVNERVQLRHFFLATYGLFW